MTDERLREVERRFRETGATEDEATLLRERVRVGALRPERVILAAALGHPAAAVLHPGRALPTEPDGLARALDPLGQEVAARAALAVASWAARAHWEEGRPLRSGSDAPEDRELFAACLESVRAWLRDPGEPTARRAAAAAAAVRHSARSSGFLEIAWATAMTATRGIVPWKRISGPLFGALVFTVRSLEHVALLEPLREGLLPWLVDGDGGDARRRTASDE